MQAQGATAGKTAKQRARRRRTRTTSTRPRAHSIVGGAWPWLLALTRGEVCYHGPGAEEPQGAAGAWRWSAGGAGGISHLNHSAMRGLRAEAPAANQSTADYIRVVCLGGVRHSYTLFSPAPNANLTRRIELEAAQRGVPRFH